MSKFTVRVSKLNDNGITTRIEEDESGSLIVFEKFTGGQSENAARAACRKSAKVLRAVALKFEDLAKLENILNADAQDRFNKEATR